jgi:hypothetical protein
LKIRTGEDAKRYIRDAMAYCNRFLNLAETILAEEAGQEEKAVARIKKIEYDDLKGPNQPEPAYLLNLEARVKAIKKRMENI